jgi:hypothetical protein
LFFKNYGFISLGQIKNLNHRGIRGHRVDFLIFFSQDCPVDNQPAVSPPGFPFFSKPSEKHECFSEGLLKKGTMAEKASLCSLRTLWLISLGLCVRHFLFQKSS